MNKLPNNIFSSFTPLRCCGCGSCINACPVGALRYSKDENKFIVPDIDSSKCIDCGLCISVCPYNHLKTEPTGKSVYALENKNEDILKNSSSGGVFAELANHVLENGGIVYGCTMDSSFKVYHIAVDNKKDLGSIMKSKYVQSFQGYCFKEIKIKLKRGESVLFSGTPCMIAGLKSYLGGKEYKGDLYTIDVVCHGVPSQDLFYDYIAYLNGVLNTPVIRYTFRDKKRGQNGMTWYTSYETSKRKYIINWPEDCYNSYYMMGRTHRDSCYECPFASRHRYSDITLCDYWNWERANLPFSYKDSISGIVINTEMGKSLYEQVKSHFKSVESDFHTLSTCNAGFSGTTEKPDDREQILEIWRNKGFNGLAAHFKSTNKKQILKGKMVRLVPYWLVYHFHRFLMSFK